MPSEGFVCVSERRSITRSDYEIGLHSKPVKRTLVAAALALILAASAAAALPIPPPQRAQMKAILTGLGAEDFAYMPTSVPPRYAIEATRLTTTEAAVTFTDPKYPQSSPKFEKYAITFSTKPYKGNIVNCFKGSDGVHRVGTALIYWKTTNVAWRCMLAPSGRLVKVSASSLLVKRHALELILASAKRIA
jgi:hypothetical protein